MSDANDFTLASGGVRLGFYSKPTTPGIDPHAVVISPVGGSTATTVYTTDDICPAGGNCLPIVDHPWSVNLLTYYCLNTMAD